MRLGGGRTRPREGPVHGAVCGVVGAGAARVGAVLVVVAFIAVVVGVVGVRRLAGEVRFVVRAVEAALVVVGVFVVEGELALSAPVSEAFLQDAGDLALGVRLGRREYPFRRGGLVDLGGAHEVLVEHHGGELVVRWPVVAVVGLLTVLERLTPTSSGTKSSVDLCGQFGQSEREFSA